MKHAKIMVVEDEALVADDIVCGLQEMGHAVTSSEASGEAAVLAAERDRPDLILMDIFLQGRMDGIQAAEAIRARWPIPVIFVTAYDDQQILERAKITEPFGYIVKPFRNTDLRIAIAMALYRAKMEKKLRRMERSLIKAQKFETAGMLAMGIAHDFNNMLFVMMGYLELAKDGLRTGENVAQYLTHVETQLLEAKNLVKKFVKVSTGGYIKKAILSINEVVDSAIDSCLKGTHMSFEYEPIRPSVFVEADWNQLLDAFSHVFNNAEEALADRPDGKLTICIDTVLQDDDARRRPELPAGPYARITIADNGKGIAPENLAKVFDPYFSTKQRGTQKGMGLGLPLAHAVIVNHGGCLHLRSDPDKGTQVYIYLPVAPDGSSR